MNIVEKFALSSFVNLRVDDFSDFKFQFSVNVDRRWQRLSAVRNLFGVAGSSMETWKTGCTLRIDLGRRMVNKWVPGLVMISKGPAYLSESFLDGQVVWKNLALTKTCCLMENGGDGDRWALADLW